MTDKTLTMTGLGEIALGILTLIVIVSIMPLVGNSIDSATSTPGWVNESNHAEGGLPGSEWNGTVNPDIPTGAGMWGTLGPFIQLAAIILIVAGFLTTLRGLKGEGQ